nr:uncharacterized protein LOC128689186 [Cherax quadricarinatus]
MLDDLKRALRMESPAPRLNESNLKKLSRGLRSSKKSLHSVHSALETCSVPDGQLGGRSVSLVSIASCYTPAGSCPGCCWLQYSNRSNILCIQVWESSRRRRTMDDYHPKWRISLTVVIPLVYLRCGRSRQSRSQFRYYGRLHGPCCPRHEHSHLVWSSVLAAPPRQRHHENEPLDRNERENVNFYLLQIMREVEGL